MNILFWGSLIIIIGLLGFIIFIGVKAEIFAKKFRKTLKVGDKVKAHLGEKGSVIAEVIEIKNDDLQSVVLSVTTTLNKIYPIK